MGGPTAQGVHDVLFSPLVAVEEGVESLGVKLVVHNQPILQEELPLARRVADGEGGSFVSVDRRDGHVVDCKLATDLTRPHDGILATLQYLVCLRFDVVLDNSIFLRTLLHEINCAKISQMDLSLTLLHMNVDNKGLSFGHMDLISIGLMLIHKVTNGHLLFQLHFGLLRLRMQV